MAWQPLGNLAKRLFRAWQAWRDDDGHFMAAAVAYHGALSLFPVLIILFSVLGFVLRETLGRNQVKEQLVRTIAEQLSPHLQVQLNQILGQVESNALINAPLGVAGLILVALALFGQFDRAFDRIWNTNRKTPQRFLDHIANILMHRLQSFLLLSFMGVVLLLAFVTGIILSAMQSYTAGLLPHQERIWRLAEIASMISINTVVFTSLYKWLPKHSLSWSSAAQGGIVAAVIWEAGRQLLTLLVVGTRLSNAYGMIGSFLAIMLWGYFACAVIFFGAEFIRVETPAEPPDSPSSD